MIRILNDRIELALGGRVATLASGGTAGERLLEAEARLKNAVAAAEELAGEARDGGVSDGTASPLRIVQKDGRGSVSRGQASVTVTFEGVVFGRATGDRARAAQLHAEACDRAAVTARSLLAELNRE